MMNYFFRMSTYRPCGTVPPLHRRTSGCEGLSTTDTPPSHRPRGTVPPLNRRTPGCKGLPTTGTTHTLFNRRTSGCGRLRRAPALGFFKLVIAATLLMQSAFGTDRPTENMETLFLRHRDAGDIKFNGYDYDGKFALTKFAQIRFDFREENVIEEQEGIKKKGDVIDTEFKLYAECGSHVYSLDLEEICTTALCTKKIIPCVPIGILKPSGWYIGQYGPLPIGGDPVPEFTFEAPEDLLRSILLCKYYKEADKVLKSMDKKGGWNTAEHYTQIRIHNFGLYILFKPGLSYKPVDVILDNTHESVSGGTYAKGTMHRADCGDHFYYPHDFNDEVIALNKVLSKVAQLRNLHLETCSNAGSTSGSDMSIRSENQTQERLLRAEHCHEDEVWKFYTKLFNGLFSGTSKNEPVCD